VPLRFLKTKYDGGNVAGGNGSGFKVTVRIARVLRINAQFEIDGDAATSDSIPHVGQKIMRAACVTVKQRSISPTE
jgi:hypothetical protein